ncbi:MAG: AbrB/MazE/SpoVT family DNA-binding domain-containing protein [Candidatus Bathyarchaeia archaeon]
MTVKTKVSSQGRTVIPVEIRRKLDIREGEEVEWTLEDGVIKVSPVREESSPTEIMEYLKDNLVDVNPMKARAVSSDPDRQMMYEWARRKLGLTR